MSSQKTRGKNWNQKEDEALCRAWLDTSQDPAIGINQRVDNLYERIHCKYTEILGESNSITFPERAPNGLKSRWHHINKCVSKFVGCLAQINNRQQSGASPEDILKQALTLFATSEKTPFALMNCYRILESAPKWQQYHVAKAPKRSLVLDHESEEFENVAIEETSFPGSSRPIGREAAKRQKRAQHAELELAKSGSLLAATAKEKLQDSLQRTKILGRLVNHSIMSVNLDGLSDVAREYYVLEQQRILSEVQNVETEKRFEIHLQEETPDEKGEEELTVDELGFL
ncbi:uncharacterized protein LOC129741547 [Uranotaenia lowii]|uniref:uncharacterized protein LOC129741547 n=1 Tax=Uranotaenia lowii TaxID=190385 RepID=UPI0024796F45|nr:uncharacterized protein LOC129741547 [Uranotaenia lowii]